MQFDGATLEAIDKPRLTTQLLAVKEIMSDGEYRTLAELTAEVCAKTGNPNTEAAVSARLRDLRKPRFGSHTVNSRRVRRGSGLFAYQLILNPAA